MDLETQNANFIDSTLVLLSCGNSPLSKDEKVWFGCVSHSNEAIKHELGRLKKTYRDIDYVSNLPVTSFTAYGSGSQDSLKVCQVRRLGLKEKEKELKSLMRSNGISVYGSRKFADKRLPAVCKVTDRHFFWDGRVKETSITFLGGSNQWCPYFPDLKTRKLRRGGVGVYIPEGTTFYPYFASLFGWGLIHCWSIEFKFSDSPSLTVLTDAIGAKAALTLRDIPEGRTRRQALTHWVREHHRKNRHAPEIATLVRQHLRGGDTCDWFGLQCTIRPSQEDIEKNEMSKVKRLLMR